MNSTVNRRGIRDAMIKYFDENHQEYDSWYDIHSKEYKDQMEFISSIIPSGRGVEIGVGTGRFASPLGIGYGIDTSADMLRVARERGVNTILADAETLPFRDGEFDFSLSMITICFLEDPLASIVEAKRVSNIVVTVFLDRNGEYVKEIVSHKTGFYEFARFYFADEVIELYDKAGLSHTDIHKIDLTTTEGKSYLLVGVTGHS